MYIDPTSLIVSWFYFSWLSNNAYTIFSPLSEQHQLLEFLSYLKKKKIHNIDPKSWSHLIRISTQIAQTKSEKNQSKKF